MQNGDKVLPNINLADRGLLVKMLMTFKSHGIEAEVSRVINNNSTALFMMIVYVC